MDYIYARNLAVLAIVGIILGFGLLYEITIIKFNNWLDNDEKNIK